MDISRLYDYLENKDFLNPETGLLFFPVYIYTYEPTKEYVAREQIEVLKKRLERPLARVDTLVLNVYETFIDFLKTEKLSGRTIFEIILETEKQEPEKAQRMIERHISKTDFDDFINKKIQSHLSVDSHLKKVYVFIYGFGSIFPYLRVHNFIARMEKFIKHIKVIIFYPGNYDYQNYHMLVRLEGDNIYRANYLNQQIENLPR